VNFRKISGGYPHIAVRGLHAFQKKAKKGIPTPQQDVELIKSRLRDAESHYRSRIEKAEGKK
jgi:phage-related protein